jgi:catechol 2,3-dioxygenase-like lactoylglutathione lyase family enzyme
MIDHVSIPVRDLNTSATFFQHVLEPLGYARLVDRPATVGFGPTYPNVGRFTSNDYATHTHNAVVIATSELGSAKIKSRGTGGDRPLHEIIRV